MTSRRIDEIPQSGPVTGNDETVIWQNGRTRRATLDDVRGLPVGLPNFGSAATRNVGTGPNDVASAQDSRIVGAAQASSLGSAATKNVGTGPNDVAGAQDSRIVGAAQTSILGSAATKNVGTGPNDVASAQDSRIVGALQPSGAGDASNFSVNSGSGISRSFGVRARDVLWAADYGVVANTGVDMTVQCQTAINAMVAQRKKLIFPPGDITLATAYPSGRTERGLGPYCLKVQGASGFSIEGSAKGSTRFVTPPLTTVQFWINECDNFTFEGIEGFGDQTGLSTGQFLAFLCVYSCRDFRFSDIGTEGYRGSVIHGNFQFNGTYERVRQKFVNSVCSGFDVASWQNMEVRKQTVSSTAGGQGFHHIYDPPNANPAFNLTGVPFANNRSNNLIVADGDYSGLTTPIAISDIENLWVERNDIHDNIRPSGDFIAGIAIGPVGGRPMRNVNVNGNRLSKNGSASGTAGLRGGLLLNSNDGQIIAAVNNNKFFDNADSGMVILGASVTLGETGNLYANIDTANQTLEYSGTPLLLGPPSSGISLRPNASLLYGAYNAFGKSVPYAAVVTTSGTLTSFTVSGSYIRVGNLVWLRIVLGITTNGTGAFPLRVSLPFAATGPAILSGGETASQGVAEFGEILSGATTVNIKTVAGTYPGGDGRNLVVSGMYEAV